MGHSLADIERAMPAIEAFAEIGDYFDQPTRTYSSGMQMRLAFSVATAFRPDLLIVDEALAVDDSYFQHKSFERIRQFRAEGVAILFVSHGMGDVRTLCDRVLLFDKGSLLKDGAPDEVVDYYNALTAAKENAALLIEQWRARDGWLQTRSGTGEARLRSLELLDMQGNDLAVAQVGQAVQLRLEAAIHAPVAHLVLGYMIRDKLGHVVWGTNTCHTNQAHENLNKGDTVVYTLPFTCTLGPGSYFASPALVSTDTHRADNFEWIDNLLVFDVMNLAHDTFIGAAWLDARFGVERHAAKILMRIVIDMQGAQTTGSRHRGIGRYTSSLVQALLRQGGAHDIHIALNSLFPESIAPIRAALGGQLAAGNIHVWHAPGQVGMLNEGNAWRRQSAQLLREAFLASLEPDFVLVTSLFEGLADDFVGSIGMLGSGVPTAVILYDLIPLIPLIQRDLYLTSPVLEQWYETRLDSLRRPAAGHIRVLAPGRHRLAGLRPRRLRQHFDRGRSAFQAAGGGAR